MPVGTILIIIALVVLIMILRIVFKIAGWILKLLVLAAAGVAIWFLFRGGT